MRQKRPSRVSIALVAGEMTASRGSTSSVFISSLLALVASMMLTVAGLPPGGSLTAGTAISLRPAVSIIEIEPRVSPTATDDRILPEVRLNEMSDPPVTDATNPTWPLDAISGCACSLSMDEEGRDTLRCFESLVRWSLPCATARLSISKRMTKVAGFLSHFTAEGSQWLLFPTPVRATRRERRKSYAFRRG